MNFRISPTKRDTEIFNVFSKVIQPTMHPSLEINCDNQLLEKDALRVIVPSRKISWFSMSRLVGKTLNLNACRCDSQNILKRRSTLR